MQSNHIYLSDYEPEIIAYFLLHNFMAPIQTSNRSTEILASAFISNCVAASFRLKAIEKLRVFLGRHEKSEMPRRYARAYYETDYDTVSQDKYDSYVAAIRAVDCFS